ncbi:MAG TPA: putative porin [Terriglobales bacterium]|nr:putative porin [Terriglobales bacterium]
MKNGNQKLAALFLTASLAMPLFTVAKAGAQTGSQKPAGTSTRKKVAAAPAITAEDIKSLRDALAAQQRQIEQLQQELRTRDEANRQAVDSLRQAQATAQEANTKAMSAETAATQATGSLDKIKADIEDVKLNQQNAALGSQEDIKRVFAAEQLLGRFRWTGDVRVRGEGFYQNRTGCGAPCTDRWRARIRARLGLDGKLGENFLGGIAVATGTIANGNPTYTDPVSTNETLTSFFERKAFGLDRAYITWQPQNMRWVTATGGKFAFNWQKTVITFDNDTNPEGFTIKLTKDYSHQMLKNVTVQPLVLMYNEVGGGPDSNAVGVQFLTRLQLGQYFTLTPSYMVLNWNGSDAIAQAASPVTLPNPNTTAVGTPTATPTAQPARIINANAMTNATAIVGTGASQRRVFVSDYMYSDLVMNLGVKTPWLRFPVTVIGEYEKNLRARNTQDTMYYFEASIGQTRNKNDFQVGYSYAHIEQDAVISQFVESDFRAPTNVGNNRFFFNWAFSPSVTGNYTLFVGRTLDTSLQNAVRTSGVAVGATEPWLKRMQIDLVYKF